MEIIKRRDFLKKTTLSGVGILTSKLWPAKVLGKEIQASSVNGAIMTNTKPQTFALEAYAKKSLNYLTRMVDKQGQPYFDVFWTNPSEAAHDWPDFGDVQSRQLQAAVMAREMTGQEASTEKIWLGKILSFIVPQTGLLFRPETTYSKHVADPGDQALTLYALVTAYVDSGDKRLLSTCRKMVDGIEEKTKRNDPQSARFLDGFLIKSLMTCARHADYEPAYRLASRLVEEVFVHRPLPTPENTLRQGAHVHGSLRVLVGAADYALYAGKQDLLGRVAALYSFVKSKATKFGFLPEVIDRKGDIVACETCALMDYIGLAVTLANHGHPEYWGDVERIARNQLVESQLSDGSWLISDSTREDTEQFTWRETGERMVGGYAGWSSPTHFLAARETLNAHWGGPELRDKTRAFQNCCGGSGTHAFFEVWKNASRFEDGVLSVNLHIDKLLPQAEILCYQPYRGLLIIKLKESCNVKVRIPDFVAPKDLKMESGREDKGTRVSENYLDLGGRDSGEMIRITYPLPTIIEEESIGNLGFRQYRYRVTYKGDTVVKMEPLGDDNPTGYSEFDKKDVPVFYGEEGPDRLYQREYMLRDADPELSAIRLDDSKLDFWCFR